MGTPRPTYELVLGGEERDDSDDSSERKEMKHETSVSSWHIYAWLRFFLEMPNVYTYKYLVVLVICT